MRRTCLTRVEYSRLCTRHDIVLEIRVINSQAITASLPFTSAPTGARPANECKSRPACQEPSWELTLDGPEPGPSATSSGAWASLGPSAPARAKGRWTRSRCREEVGESVSLTYGNSFLLLQLIRGQALHRPRRPDLAPDLPDQQQYDRAEQARRHPRFQAGQRRAEEQVASRPRNSREACSAHAGLTGAT